MNSQASLRPGAPLSTHQVLALRVAPFQITSTGTPCCLSSVPRAFQIDIISTSLSRNNCCDWLPSPPHFDVRLDLVELLEGAVEIERIELVERHAVGDQREDAGARRIAEAERTRAREFLDVPEIGPRLRAAVRIFVGAVA